jgi:uncharacterized protein (TIGR03435 family)
MEPLLQSLLAKRFNLKYHCETPELSVYALMAYKNHKLKVKAEGEGTTMNTNRTAENPGCWEPASSREASLRRSGTGWAGSWWIRPD